MVLFFKEVTKVSIIIPVYNAEDYIFDCVRSAQDQYMDEDDYEIIVVNDGSTDKTRNILDNMNGITVIDKENGGTASALNEGIRQSKGDFIKWLSADDVLLYDALPKMLRWIYANKPIDIENSIYYTNYHIINQYGEFIKDFIEPETPPDLWKRFYGNGSTSLIHRNVFAKCGLFDESLRHSEDYEFWLRATQLHGIKLQLIPIFTINYRNHPEQLTNKVGGTLDKQIKEKIKNELSQSVVM